MCFQVHFRIDIMLSDRRENVRLQELIGEAWIKIKMSGHGDAF